MPIFVKAGDKIVRLDKILYITKALNKCIYICYMDGIAYKGNVLFLTESEFKCLEQNITDVTH